MAKSLHFESGEWRRLAALALGRQAHLLAVSIFPGNFYQYLSQSRLRAVSPERGKFYSGD
jgi:hypothetical protein